MQSLRFSYVLSMSCLVAKRSQQVSFDVCNNYICLVYSFILFVPLPLFLSTSFHPFLSLHFSHTLPFPDLPRSILPCIPSTVNTDTEFIEHTCSQKLSTPRYE